MSVNRWDKLWLHVNIVTCDHHHTIIKDGVVAVKDGVVVCVGKVDELTDSPEQLANEIFDMPGYWLTPGLIDCHTHLVYAGNRAGEFEQRLNGVSYEEIARNGGGIKSTVAATRLASEDQLFDESLPRAMALQKSGVTTVEIKSGYGLDWPTERKMLRVAQRIEKAIPIRVKRSFLGAHTTPIEFTDKSQAYIDLVCDEMLPQIAAENLADSVDVFCETIAFNIQQTEQVFVAAKKYNLSLKCHGEQLSDSGSALLAAKYQALSVDHLEFASEESVKAMAKAGTIAVLLPGAFYFLRETQKPPIDKMRELGVRMAVASDCNPGTSPILSMTTIMNMASTLFRLTPQEVMLGVTQHAAQALGIDNDVGAIAEGKQADFAIWDINQPAELMYYLGNQPLIQLVKSGEVIQL